MIHAELFHLALIFSADWQNSKESVVVKDESNLSDVHGNRSAVLERLITYQARNPVPTR